MKALTRATPSELGGLEGLFFDLDDTVLTHGVLTREAYGAIWDLHESGLKLVAVTGRPSGWAEVLVRQWPIDGAVSENGAVFVVRDGAGVRLIERGTAAEISERRARLAALGDIVARAFPALALADDVRGRLSDLAWDIGERVKVPEAEIAALAALVIAEGFRSTRSTVHLHATLAVDDKASGAVRFARERFGADPGRTVVTWGFAGDSPNDAPCFSAFRTTFGVANVRRFASKLAVPPRYVADGERGAGFVEIARAILAARRPR